MIDPETLQAASVVRVIYHENMVQLMCMDERGLLSVYFDLEPFNTFCKSIYKAGLKLYGLKIQFNRDIVYPIGKRKMRGFCPTLNRRRLSVLNRIRY